MVKYVHNLSYDTWQQHTACPRGVVPSHDRSIVSGQPAISMHINLILISWLPGSEILAVVTP